MSSIAVNIFNHRKIIVIGIVFSVYFYVMLNTYLKYKFLDPVLQSSITKNMPYLIDTEGYKLPDFDPFDYSVSRFLRLPPEIDCSDGKRSLTTGISNYKDNLTLHGSAILVHEEHLVDYSANEELLSVYNANEGQSKKSSNRKEYFGDLTMSFSCCYQGIRRDASKDDNFKEYLQDPKRDFPDSKFFVEKTCHEMAVNITFVNERAVLVQCSSNSIVFYRNIHFFIPLKQSHIKDNTLGTKTTIPDRLNVMIVGIDSVSRMNMQRYMPETFKYLKEIEAIDLKGFNKNFENTFPNVLAMLSGWYEQGREFVSAFKKSDNFFDSVPFLWKNFSAAGYTTLYGDDCSYAGTFAHKNKKGFIISPTDYYFRPYVKAAEEILGSNKGLVWISDCQLCGGNKLMFQHVFDFAATTSKTFNKVKPYFSFFWTTSLTHDKLQNVGVSDKFVLNFLKDMIDNNYWNNTIVFFMSDHGVRYGGIRETFLGKLEESLPFNFIITPKWFKQTYPILYENLIHNQDRLATTMDLHETFKDILLERYKDDAYINSLHSNKRKWLSLFRKIPSTRTCLDADIPLNYCAGQVAIQVPETDLVRLAAKSVLSNLNKGLSKFPMCYQLSDFKIKRSFILKFFHNQVTSNHTFYEVQMISYPGEALLEAIVKIQFTDRNSYIPSIIGDISRINQYGNQSFCVNDYVYRKFCLCK